jgi:hypothetical protein
MAPLVEVAGKRNRSSPGSGTPLPCLSDAPSGTTKQDHLGFGPYAEALAFLIDWKSSKPPLTMAINGPWGVGKTSLARLVQEQLKTHGDWDDDHIICEFSAWKHDDAPNLGAAFAAKVAQSASEERRWWRRLIQPLPSRMLTPEQRWRRQLYIILASFAVTLGLVLGPDTREIITAAVQPTGTHWINAERAAHGFGLTLIIILAALAFIYPKIFSGTQAVARFINDPKSEAARGSIDSVTKQLGSLISSATRGNRRFVVFVEDLDRCRPPRAVDVCEVVAQLLYHDDVVTVLVGDMDTIARSAAIKYRALELPTPGTDMAAYEEYGRSYMEKLVQLQFDLPQPPVEQLKELRKLLSSDNGESAMQSSGFGAALRRPLKSGFRRALKIGGYALIVAAAVAVTAVAYYSLTHLLTHARLLGINVQVILVIVGAGLAALMGVSPIADILRQERRRRTRNEIDRDLLAGQYSGKTIFQAAEALSESEREIVRESREQIVRRRYFNVVFGSPETAKARNQMLQLLDRFLPKEPRAIKKFAYRMRLATAIGIAHELFKFEKGEVPELFVDRFGKWLVLLDKWPNVSLIGQDEMARLEIAAMNSTSGPLQEELQTHGLSDTADIEGLRELLVMYPPFGDVSQLASVCPAPRKAARPGS